MTNRVPPKPADQLTVRVKVQFTPAQAALVEQRSDDVGMTTAGYIRSLVLAELDASGAKAGPSDKKARQHASMLRVAELHALSMQVKKLGGNVNQLAKQANIGLVPITRAEVIYILNQHQTLMSEAKAAVEKMLA